MWESEIHLVLPGSVQRLFGDIRQFLFIAVDGTVNSGVVPYFLYFSPWSNLGVTHYMPGTVLNSLYTSSLKHQNNPMDLLIKVPAEAFYGSASSL